MLALKLKITNLQFVEPQRLGIELGTKEERQISLGRRHSRYEVMSLQGLEWKDQMERVMES